MTDELRSDLLEVFRSGVGASLPDPVFNALALRAFQRQFHENPVYGAYCRARGATPASVERWEEVPAVPTRAFKELPLVTGDLDEVERVFRTSGTSRGLQGRGSHHVADLQLYDEALLPNFKAHLLPDLERARILALVPDPQRVPESSLGYMVGRGMAAFGDGKGGFFLELEEGVNAEGFSGAVGRAVEDQVPVLLCGTAFAFVHLLDRSPDGGGLPHLPPGSRVMETGGFKGRSRTVSRDDLYGGLEGLVGVPASRIVNEYGMTELLSQFYEPVLLEGEAGAGASRGLRPPPWVRTRILDPVELTPVSPGEPGLLCHFDLANLRSVCHVLTEDLGEAVGEVDFRVLGRSPGAEPRGCSLATEELLRAHEERR